MTRKEAHEALIAESTSVSTNNSAIPARAATASRRRVRQRRSSGDYRQDQEARQSPRTSAVKNR